MSETWTYKGQQPIVIPPQNIEKICDLMLKQLEIMKQMTQQAVFVSADTKITRTGD